MINEYLSILVTGKRLVEVRDSIFGARAGGFGTLRIERAIIKLLSISADGMPNFSVSMVICDGILQ